MSYCDCCPHRDKGTPCPAIDSIEGRPAHPAYCGLCPNPEYRQVIENGGTAPSRPPSIVKQAVSFTGAAIKHVMSGLPQASPAQQASRLAICEGCDRKADDKCLECGCLLVVKTSWAEQRCPLDKWGPFA